MKNPLHELSENGFARIHVRTLARKISKKMLGKECREVQVAHTLLSAHRFALQAVPTRYPLNNRMIMGAHHVRWYAASSAVFDSEALSRLVTQFRFTRTISPRR